MRRQIPGLHSQHQDFETSFAGVFLVPVERAWHRRHPHKPFVEATVNSGETTAVSRE